MIFFLSIKVYNFDKKRTKEGLEVNKRALLEIFHKIIPRLTIFSILLLQYPRYSSMHLEK